MCTSTLYKLVYIIDFYTFHLQSLNEWGEKVKKVIDMRSMFLAAKKFNQPIDKWNIENVHMVSYMFCNMYVVSSSSFQFVFPLVSKQSNGETRVPSIGLVVVVINSVGRSVAVSPAVPAVMRE